MNIKGLVSNETFDWCGTAHTSLPGLHLSALVPESFPTWKCCDVRCCTNSKNPPLVPQNFLLYCTISVLSKLSDTMSPGFPEVRADLKPCMISGHIVREKI